LKPDYVFNTYISFADVLYLKRKAEVSPFTFVELNDD